MSWFRKLIDGVADVAPALVAATTGNPVGALAMLARKIMGASPDADIDSISQQLIANPEKMMAFRLESRKLELEELRVRTLDVQNARKTLSSSRGAVVISTVVVVGYLSATLLVMTSSLPEGSENLAYLLLGNLGTGFGMVLTFWLGSSVGSKEKSATLSAYAEAAKADAVAKGGGHV